MTAKTGEIYTHPSGAAREVLGTSPEQIEFLETRPGMHPMRRRGPWTMWDTWVKKAALTRPAPGRASRGTLSIPDPPEDFTAELAEATALSRPEMAAIIQALTIRNDQARAKALAPIIANLLTGADARTPGP